MVARRMGRRASIARQWDSSGGSNECRCHQKAAAEGKYLAAKNREEGSLQSAAEARAAAMKDMVAGRLQGAAEGEAAAIGEMMTRRLRSATRGEGAMTTEATVAVEVGAKTATRESGTPEEMADADAERERKAGGVRVARASGAEAVNMAARRAAKIMVVESMQAGGMEAA